MVNTQVVVTCQIHSLMEKLKQDLNNNGCSEIIILKDMQNRQVDGTSSSLVTITLQQVAAPMMVEFITPLLMLLLELLKNHTSLKTTTMKPSSI
jgi:hypothetical protein